jgi:2-dehydropantoate 2-reductase
MKILVVGAGGVGGVVGGRLLESGADVTFLARQARRDHLLKHGLSMKSPLGDVQVPARAVTAAELKPEYDVAILTNKAYDLGSVIDDLGGATANGRPLILPLLNGFAHLEVLDAKFGRGNVLGGTCVLSATLEDGVVRHHNKLQRVVFGDRGGDMGRVNELAEVFRRSALDFELSTDIEQDLWEKLVTLSTLAALTSLMRASVGEIVSTTLGRDAMARMLACATEVATREGRPPRTASREFAQRVLFDTSSALKASLAHDLERGARVESDQILGWLFERARVHGVERDVLEMAVTNLKVYEARSR